MIWTLLGIMVQDSFLAIGGMNPVLPELQRQVVDVHHWMTAQDFVSLFALAQAAPGPNMLVTTLVGWRVAGFNGALVATAGICVPPALLTYGVASFWHRFRDRPWRRLVQSGLTPVTCGLVAAAAELLAGSTVHGAATALLLAVSVSVLVFTKVHPLAMLLAGAAIGAFGLLG